MNNYAKLCHVPQLSGSKVRYYSVHFEGKEKNEIEDFLLRHEQQADLQEAFDEILAWIDGIAHITSALEHLFRHERKAAALPPDNRVRKRNRERFSIQYQEINRLRLYLIRLNDHVVILLNGGEKTHDNPEQCPKVKRYFREAQQIADALDDALQSGDIKYNPNKTNIHFSPEFEISFP